MLELSVMDLITIGWIVSSTVILIFLQYINIFVIDVDFAFTLKLKTRK